MNTLSTLWPYLKLHQRQFFVGTLAVFGASWAVTLPAYFTRLIIDGLTRATATGAVPGQGISAGQVAIYALLAVVSVVFSGALMVMVRRQIVYASRQIEYEVRRDLFGHLSTLDKYYFDRARTGDLMNRLTGDLSAVREMIGFGSWQVASVVASFVVSFFWFFSLSWQLTLAVLLIFPVIIGTLFVLARLISARYVAMQEQNSVIAAKAQENFSGARVVKGYAIEDREIGEYKTMNAELIRRALRLTTVEGPLQASMSLLMGLAYVTVLIYGGRMILGLVPNSPLTLGQFTQFALVLDRLAWPMLSIGMITNMLQRGSASWGRLQELFVAQPMIKDDGRTDVSIKTLRGEIEFDKVSLNFDGQQVLRDVSLRIPAGQTLGITGPTGSGKTVLGNLVTRLMDASSGTVRVDGVDVRRMPLTVLRENVAVVPQEPFLFSDTIAANVAFGLDNATYAPTATRISVLKSKAPPPDERQPDMNRVRAAARVAGLAGEIERFPQGYDTMLGERGVTLSGGQRQRTALARAVAREPRILVLDDAMSAVDTETESRILSGLRQVQEGRTVLLIGHRVSTLRHADHIIVMERGTIVEQGSHEELLALGGHYAELDRQQRLEGDLSTEDEAQLTKAAPGISPDTDSPAKTKVNA